jgi:hypothetical protein
VSSPYRQCAVVLLPLPYHVAECSMLMMIREKGNEPSRKLAVIESLTFPDNQDRPTERFQLTLLYLVPFDVLSKLL